MAAPIANMALDTTVAVAFHQGRPFQDEAVDTRLVTIVQTTILVLRPEVYAPINDRAITVQLPNGIVVVPSDLHLQKPLTIHARCVVVCDKMHASHEGNLSITARYLMYKGPSFLPDHSHLEITSRTFVFPTVDQDPLAGAASKDITAFTRSKLNFAATKFDRAMETEDPLPLLIGLALVNNALLGMAEVDPDAKRFTPAVRDLFGISRDPLPFPDAVAADPRVSKFTAYALDGRLKSIKED